MNIKGFLNNLRTRGYSEKTIVSYRGELEKFRSFLLERKLHVNQVKARHVVSYLECRDPRFETKPASTRRRMAVLSSFYDFVGVMSNGHVRNPLANLRTPKRQPPNPKPLTEEEIGKLTSQIDKPRDRAIIALLLHSGLRLSELCSLDRSSIRIEHLTPGPDETVVGVGRVLGKGSKEREFLVDLPTLRLIHTYLSERGPDDNPALFLSNRQKRIHARSIQHLLRTWCKRLDLPPSHPHQLRASFATRLSRLGVPTLDISHLLGHASLDTTQAYVKPDARRIRTEYFAALERLNPIA